MKEKEPGTGSAAGSPGNKELTRREVLREMGKAVYVAPALLVLRRPRRNRPGAHDDGPPPSHA